MNALERIDAFKRLWGIVIPTIKCPPEGQILRWTTRFCDSAVEHGLSRLQAKVRKGEIVHEDNAGRYLTAVLVGEERQRREGLAAEMAKGGVR